MPTLMYIVPVTEMTIGEDGAAADLFLRELPHARIIADEACSSWDEIHFASILDRNPLVAGGVMRTPMVAKVGRGGRLELEIKVIAARGFRLGTRRRDAIFDELDAQMKDGWGKSFFGRAMSDEDGNLFRVDRGGLADGGEGPSH